LRRRATRRAGQTARSHRYRGRAVLPIRSGAARSRVALRSEAAEAAARLFSGDFSAEVLESFGRLVFPLYAAPEHEDIPACLIALSTINAELVAYFFQQLAPKYDVRPQLGSITARTLVIVGRHDWVCPPAAGRELAAGIPDARLVELPGAGHFGFSETPAPFLRAVHAHLAHIDADADA
jgi:proline iminopeptidase